MTHSLWRVGEYLIATQLPRGPKRKTYTWEISDLHGGCLGYVSWLGRWRQYTFRPAGGSGYSAGCLRDMARFLQGVNAAHKAARTRRRKEETG